MINTHSPPLRRSSSSSSSSPVSFTPSAVDAHHLLLNRRNSLVSASRRGSAKAMLTEDLPSLAISPDHTRPTLELDHADLVDMQMKTDPDAELLTPAEPDSEAEIETDRETDAEGESEAVPEQELEPETELGLGASDAIVVDTEPRYSGPEREFPPHAHDPLRPRTSTSSGDEPRRSTGRARPTTRKPSAVDVIMEVDERSASGQAPKPPLRYLEHEQSHLQKPGVLKLTDFDVKGTLGSGTFARVLLVRHRASSSGAGAQRAENYFALKVLKKSDIVRLRQVDHVKNERFILSRVRHPFVVDLYATFQDSRNIYMLLSYVPGGELFTHLRRAGRFTPDVTRFYLATIVLALKYLHSFNIIYRDLKPENLMLDSRGYLRLTDFGFAKIVDDRTWTLCGTPEYLAPEIIQNDGHGKAADWWACGVLAYEMMMGYPPFFDETAYGIYDKILNGRPYYPKEMDPLSRELVKAFLVGDKTKRLGNLNGEAQDVLDHPWFRGVDWDALERREIRAPIIPHVSSVEDTRHFLHLPLPPAEEIPGLRREEPRSFEQRHDPVWQQFADFSS